MYKELVLVDSDFERLKKNGFTPSQDLIIMRQDVFHKIFDDTFIRMNKQMLEKFKDFCKAIANNNDFKKVAPNGGGKGLVNIIPEQGDECEK